MIPPETSIERTPRSSLHPAWGLLLVLFACATFLVLLSHGPRMGDHECINAAAARQTLQNGHVLIPQVNGAPWVRKPPLGTWLIAAAASLLERGLDAPVSDWTARLPSAVAGVIDVLALWWLGRLLFGPRTGLIAGFIASGAAGFIVLGRNAQVDMVMTTLTTLAFACFWRGCLHERPSGWAMIGFYASLALANLAKAPLPIAIVGGALFVYWFITKPLAMRSEGATLVTGLREQVRQLLKLRLLTGAVLFLILFGLWPAYIWWNVPDVLELWRTEYLDRASGEMSERENGPFYYLPLLFALLAPYSLSLIEAMAAPFLAWYRSQRAGLLYAFTWAVFGTMFLSTAAFKRPHYLLPVLPAYALLLAPVIDRLFFGSVAILLPRSWIRLVSLSAPVSVCAAAVIGGVLVRREFPAMLPAYAILAAAGAVLWTASALAFFADRRALSFVLLHLGTAVVAVIGWTGASRYIDTTPEALALADQMRRIGITRQHELIWVGRRPKATIEFYADLCAKRLITDLELARMRRGRADVSDTLLDEYARRIREQLQRTTPVYLIMESGYYYLFERTTGIKAKVLFELHGFNKDEPGEDLIVVTQLWNDSTQPISRPACPATASGPAGAASRRLPRWHPDRSAPRSGFHFTCHENNAGQDQDNPSPLPR